MFGGGKQAHTRYSGFNVLLFSSPLTGPWNNVEDGGHSGLVALGWERMAKRGGDEGERAFDWYRDRVDRG